MKIFKKHYRTPQELLAEQEGLERLRKACHLLKIPTTLKASDLDLEMEYIEGSSPTSFHYKTLAKGLDELHSSTKKWYGLTEDNFIGLGTQAQGLASNWGKFFLERRLQFMVKKITDESLKHTYLYALDKASSLIVDFLNEHSPAPSLVHGDLWQGNILFTSTEVFLIDPASYYGDREVDIAMTEMFGGLPDVFYSAYAEFYELTEAYHKRKIIYNLYHYLNHLNLFGNSYKPSCDAGIDFCLRL